MDSPPLTMQDAAMPISEKNALRAIKQVGLDQPGPIRADVKETLVVKAARLAEYYDRMDAAIGENWIDMSGVAEMIHFELQQSLKLPGLPQKASESPSATDPFAAFMNNLDQSKKTGLIDFSPVLTRPFRVTNQP